MSLNINASGRNYQFSSKQEQKIASITNKASMVSCLMGGGSSLLGGTSMANLTNTVLGGGGDNTLADYASLKNGSYGKLMKAYYKEAEKESKGETSAAKTSTKDTKISAEEYVSKKRAAEEEGKVSAKDYVKKKRAVEDGTVKAKETNSTTKKSETPSKAEQLGSLFDASL